MSTNGMYGFKKNGKYKMGYNHSDSYLSGLGCDIVEFIKNTSLQEMSKIFDKIIIVSRQSEAPKEYIEKYTNLEYGNGRFWHDLICNTEGDLNYYKQELIHMTTNECDIEVNEDMEDEGNLEGNDYRSCEEWSYVINLDTGNLEIYNTSYDEIEYRNLFKRTFGLSDIEADQGFLCSLPFDNMDKRFKIISDLYDEFEEKANSDDFEEEETNKLNGEYDIETIQQLDNNELKIIYRKSFNSNMPEKFLQDIKNEIAERFYKGKI